MAKENHPPDKRYEELEPMLLDIIERGGTFWGKFDCEKCGSRQTFEKPNILYRAGECEECGHISQLEKWGLLVLEVLK